MDGLAIDHVEEFDEIMAMVFGFGELDELGAQGVLCCRNYRLLLSDKT